MTDVNNSHDGVSSKKKAKITSIKGSLGTGNEVPPKPAERFYRTPECLGFFKPPQANPSEPQFDTDSVPTPEKMASLLRYVRDVHRRSNRK